MALLTSSSSELLGLSLSLNRRGIEDPHSAVGSLSFLNYSLLRNAQEYSAMLSIVQQSPSRNGSSLFFFFRAVGPFIVAEQTRDSGTHSTVGSFFLNYS